MDKIAQIIYEEICNEAGINENKKYFWDDYAKKKYQVLAEKISNRLEPFIRQTAKPRLGPTESGRYIYENLNEVKIRKMQEMMEFLEQFKNEKGQTFMEALNQSRLSV